MMESFLNLPSIPWQEFSHLGVMITHSSEVPTEYLLGAGTMLRMEDGGAAVAPLMGLWRRQKPRLRESRLIVVR